MSRFIFIGRRCINDFSWNINVKNCPDSLRTELFRKNIYVIPSYSKYALNSLNTTGNNSLHCSIMDNNVEIVKQILKHGGNPYIKNSHGKDGFDIAMGMKNGRMIHALKSYRKKMKINE